MKRSLSAALAIIATVCGASAARADLDSLLGDWAEAASHDSDAYASQDLSLAPAADASQTSSQAKDSDSNGKTLTSHAGEMIYEDAGVVGAYGGPDHFAGPTPTANPYYSPASDCGCDSGSCSKPSCSKPSCGCGSGCGKLVNGADCHCKGLSECRPHFRPTLPPPSSLLQMFRSRNSYSAVWAGYAEETRNRCRNKSPHLLGTWQTCDHGGLIEPACTTCNSCESGCDCDSGCDR